MVWKPGTRQDHARTRSGYASCVTDAEWKKLEPLMPARKKRGRAHRTELRSVIDAIFYLLQSGCQWDMLPRDFPPWQTVYGYFALWRTDGAWARRHDALYCQCRDLEGREKARQRQSLTRNPAKPALTQGAM